MRHNLHSISELHSILNLKKPEHPLISVINLKDIEVRPEVSVFVFDFYYIALKLNFDGRVKYGRQYFDFDSGSMFFSAPRQAIAVEEVRADQGMEGYLLFVHTDFLHGYSLAKKINDFGFFSYAFSEALHFSEKEKEVVTKIVSTIEAELQNPIDVYTQDIVISYLDLLLHYCNRFYNRQFITRKKISSDLLVKFDDLLKEYYDSGNMALPSVQYFADRLFLSPRYLNDMLKSLTGQTTQEHIQNRLIEKSKELLSLTELSVGEIAYQMGFKYPQSFNKLFKRKMNLTPLEYRRGFD